MERLRRRSEFRAVATGLRASGRAFVLQARRREDEGPPRVGFTVSKQVGNAVERNRVRRRLREIVRLSAAGQAAASPLRAGHDYVLVGRRAALTAPFEDLVGELDAALGRIHRGERGGPGSARKRSLHQAGSPSPPPRRGRRNSPDTALEAPARPTADPPREI